jgi:hypothetical protein
VSFGCAVDHAVRIALDGSIEIVIAMAVRIALDGSSKTLTT